MKILHCCLANFYVDNSSYQENIITKMHRHQGHEVEILASTETFLNRTELGYTVSGRYINEHNIPVTRLNYSTWLPHRIAVKVRVYEGVKENLDRFNPDIIFIHGPQFYNVNNIVEYANRNKDVKVFVDSHTDFINSGRNFLSKYLQHKILYRYYVKQLIPICSCFFGVLPLRVQFLIDVYRVPKEKTDLLRMGADDLILAKKNQAEIRLKLRKSLGLNEDDLLIFTGGKIRPSKRIVELIDAVNQLGIPNVYLCVAGTPLKSFEQEYRRKTQNFKFIEAGWQSNESMYDYLLSSDLAVFPGTHSVLWEQAVGVGLPSVFRRIEGISHLDIGGNCEFFTGSTAIELLFFLRNLLADRSKLKAMKQAACGVKRNDFLYSNIAKKSIEIPIYYHNHNHNAYVS